MGKTTTGSLNLSGVERRLDKVETAVKQMESSVSDANGKLDSLCEDLSAAKEELRALKESFETFVNENKKTAALQKAATELIRVRQELDQTFGKYKVVRETMLGVLQATDLALVKKTTIAQVTEELMLSTPDYWLAPCLVAVSAWIGNDRDLAERAIREAVKRDEEKTALAMALICRRNNRTETCYEWLSRYFAKQSAAHFTETNFTYLNAYLNGVFGPDDKHMCDDYVAKWMKEIQNNGEEFEAKQTELWRRYCEDFTVDLEGQFPQLHDCTHEYSAIADYVSRISSVDKIAGNFSKIKNVEVDQQTLKKEIDQTLVTLISRYDEKEEPLRKEEKYLTAVRFFDGDTQAARESILEAERKRTEDAIDLVSQMTNILVKKEASHPSEKKTAVSFLSSYIRNGFESYITEKKNAFPQKVTVRVEDWTGTSTDGKNAAELKASLERHMAQRKAEALYKAETKKPQMLKYGAIALAVFGVAGLFLAAPLGILLLLAGGFCFYQSKKTVRTVSEEKVLIEAEYQAKAESGKNKIEEALNEWEKARDIVRTFENQAMRDVVA